MKFPISNFQCQISNKKKSTLLIRHLIFEIGSIGNSRQRRAGFTLIELLIVFSIIGIISTLSIASFVTYSRGATIRQAALDVAGLVREAKSRTQSQIKPSSCTGTLQGYQVDICGLTGSTCQAANTYQLSVRCTGGNVTLVTKKLPANVSFSQSGTTSARFAFQVVTGGVTGAGAVVLSGFNTTSVITVDNGGTIDVN